MNQGTQGYSLMKKTEGRKSRDTVSLNMEFYTLLTRWHIFVCELLKLHYLTNADPLGI
jgi:hypothetical protein